MKKRIILCMVFLLGMVLVPRDKVLAYGTEVTEGGLTYELNENDKTATLTKAAASVTDVIVPSKVSNNGVEYTITEIGLNSFDTATNLESVSFPDTVTELWDGFWNCEKLSYVKLPTNIKEIKSSTFHDCISLKEINIPDGVVKIGDSAFGGCTSLQKVTLPKSVKKIGSWAFYGCTALETMDLPDNLESIGDSAFYQCRKWKSAVSLKNVETIPIECFYQCSSITKVELSDQVKTIEKYAFKECGTETTEWKIPDTITSFGDMAFAYCKGITKMVIPQNAEFGRAVYNGCTGIKGNFEVPAFFKEIPSGLCMNCTGITSVTIPDAIEGIGDYAFAKTGITSIVIPGGVRKIDKYAFYGCENLTTITMKNGPETIGDHAFTGCKKLVSIDIPDSVTGMGIWVFSGCSELKKASLSRNITKIEKATFRGCQQLESVILSPAVTDIADNAFEYCYAYVYYPAALGDVSDKVTGQCAYTIQKDNTVAVHVAQGSRALEIPESLYGMPISSLTFAEGVNPIVICGYHYLTNMVSKDAEGHIGACTLCDGNDIEKQHDFVDGKTACKCGYVPFVITSQPTGLKLTEGYSAGSTLTVGSKSTYGTEKVEYQWYENDTLIAGATASSYTIPTGKGAGTYTYYCIVSNNGYSAESDKAGVTVTAKEKVSGIELTDPEQTTLKKGDCFKDKTGKMIYKVISDGKKPTACFVKMVVKTKKVSIPATVKVGGVSYSVVEIANNAFKNDKKLTSVVIGKNISKIGKQAFYGCKKLKTITIQSKKLTKKRVGSKAFGKIHSKATFKLPKAKYKSYRSMLKKKGPGKKVNYKKMK